MIPRIRTVQIKNYKSLASVSVDLEPFTVLVGPNGSGKSNFIDALAFVQEALSGTLEVALSKRGGIESVCNRFQVPGGFELAEEASEEEIDEALKQAGIKIGFRFSLSLGRDFEADYGFEISALCADRMLGTFHISRERCTVRRKESIYRFEVEEGHFTEKIPGIDPILEPHRLALYAASNRPEFRQVYALLSSVRSYSIDPRMIRELQEPALMDFLRRDGSNAATILHRLERPGGDRERYNTVCSLVSALVPGIQRVTHKALETKETVAFVQESGAERAVYFYPTSISDGTLRILGILLAAYQEGYHPVVAIEEPEATVHPAAADTLMEILTDAANERQILITTHSPDLLDYKDLKDTEIRVVNWQNGQTYIAPLSNATRQTIRERLYTPGELLSVDELNLNVGEATQSSELVDLFGPPFERAQD